MDRIEEIKGLVQGGDRLVGQDHRLVNENVHVQKKRGISIVWQRSIVLGKRHKK